MERQATTYTYLPTSLLKRERLRYQMLFDTNKPLFGSVCSTQGVVADTCAQLWKNANDLVAEAGIHPLQSIDETTSVSTRVVEVEYLKKASQTSIQDLMFFDEKSIDEHLLFPTRLTQKIRSFVNAMVERLQQEVAAKVCNGESVLERLQSSKLESIFNDYSTWKEHQDQQQEQTTS
jgi:hypothetical protein